MTSDMLILYFNKWNEVNITYSPTSYERIIKPFLATILKLNDAKTNTLRQMKRPNTLF